MGTAELTERRVLVRGVSALYADEGTGPVLLLVHGNVTSFRSWHRIIAEFRSTCRVLAVSMPGYHHTEPLDDVGLAGSVAFLVDFLDAVSVDRAIVLGHSAGGLIAATLALRHPGRVTRLVLADSAGLGRAVSPFAVATAVTPVKLAEVVISAMLLPGGNLPLLVAGALQLRQPWRVPVRSWRDQARALQSRTLLTTSFQAVRAAIGPGGQRRDHVVVDRLAELTMPTLVIWGLTDDVYPVWQAIRAVRRLPRGRLAVLVGAGHITYLDNHAEFVDALGPFVRTEPHVRPAADDGRE